jgi:hypothetical protein
LAYSLEGFGRDAEASRKNKNAAPLGRPVTPSIIGESGRYGQFARDAAKKTAAPARPVAPLQNQVKTLKRLAQSRRAPRAAAPGDHMSWGKAGSGARRDSCARFKD